MLLIALTSFGTFQNVQVLWMESILQYKRHTGSDFFNYKGYFSIVLFGVMDANYRFLYFHVGSQGRISDGGVFETTSFKKLLTDCKLNLPECGTLPGRNKLVPYVFLADDALPLSINLLKPYPGAQEKGSSKRIFNYRLSRARRISENVFGMLSSVFRLFRKPLLLEPETAECVVMACIYLHNFLRTSTRSKNSYTPPGTFDSEDKDTGEILDGSWRKHSESNCFRPYRKVARNASNAAKDIRK